MKRDVQFYLLDNELDVKCLKGQGNGEKLSLKTSVNRYTQWFFSCLKEMGTIKCLSDRQKPSAIKNLLSHPRAILISAQRRPSYKKWEKIPFRILELSLGGFTHRGVLQSKFLSRAQIQLVSTRFEANLLKERFGHRLSRMEVFTPRIDTDFYSIPDKISRNQARHEEGVPEGWAHVVYAGRIIATKGVCQLVRAMNLWPTKKVVLTIAGQFEEENRMFYSSSTHENFKLFWEKEILSHGSNVTIRSRRIRSREELRQVFWSADVFVNPSFQPDENFGITPREALACGVPVVTTDFGGLRPLAHRLPWSVNTYPTLAGICCSISALRLHIDRACACAKMTSPKVYRKMVMDECDPLKNKKNLTKAVDYLLKQPPEGMANAPVFERTLNGHLFNGIEERFLRNFNQKMMGSEGANVYGDRPVQLQDLYMQALYCSQILPPKVARGTTWVGFFRTSLWDAEKAVVSFGFPGPRMRHYDTQDWRSLKDCAQRIDPEEYKFKPFDALQVKLVQELVILGFLVSFSL